MLRRVHFRAELEPDAGPLPRNHTRLKYEQHLVLTRVGSLVCPHRRLPVPAPLEPIVPASTATATHPITQGFVRYHVQCSRQRNGMPVVRTRLPVFALDLRDAHAVSHEGERMTIIFCTNVQLKFALYQASALRRVQIVWCGDLACVSNHGVRRWVYGIATSAP